MSSDKEVTSEHLSPILEGASYDEVYSSESKLEEDVTWSTKRELSAHSPTKEKEDEEGKGRQRGGRRGGGRRGR